MGKFLLYWLILPIYGKFLVIKSKFQKASNEKKDRFILIFTNRYLIHFIIALIGLGVSIFNILGYETKDDYGQKALMYNLAGISNTEIIEDSTIVKEDFKVYNYQDPSLFMEEGSFISNNSIDNDNIFTDNVTTQGDLALINPDIINTTEETTIKGSRGIREYEVVEGDTIAKIANKFGVSVNTILWANGLSSTSLVKPGQKLKIPLVSGVVHTVVKGDTLSRIAQKYAVSESTIREYNIIDGDKLSIGQVLIIPGGRLIETPKPRPSVTVKVSRPASDNNIVVSGTGKMSWPNACYRISQYYKGWIHTGVDIACPSGSAIRAADDGTVIRVQYGRTGYGYNVIIDHGNGISTLYAHMSRIDVVVGQYVAKGEVIGAEGSTGRSTGPHLHFEVRISGSHVNPLNYIR
mgnify:CR=1 FL=1